MAREAISEHLISLGEHRPPDPPSLVCLLAYNLYAYIHIRHPRNPPSENPGYGPGFYHRTNTFRTYGYEKRTPLNSKQRTLIRPRRTLANSKFAVAREPVMKIEF